MVRASELRGKTVITVPEGKEIGIVADVLFQPEEQRLGALVVESPSFAGLQILLAADITSVGGDAVATQSATKLQDQARFGESAELVSLSEASGRRVATVSGNYAGELFDVHLDPATGRITGYEVTGGLFARMLGQSHTIEASEHTHLGKDLLIVADEAIRAKHGEETRPPAQG